MSWNRWRWHVRGGLGWVNGVEDAASEDGHPPIDDEALKELEEIARRTAALAAHLRHLRGAAPIAADEAGAGPPPEQKRKIKRWQTRF